MAGWVDVIVISIGLLIFQYKVDEMLTSGLNPWIETAMELTINILTVAVTKAIKTNLGCGC